MDTRVDGGRGDGALAHPSVALAAVWLATRLLLAGALIGCAPTPGHRVPALDASTPGPVGSATLVVDATDPNTGAVLPLKVTLRGLGRTPTPEWRGGPGDDPTAGVSPEPGTWLVARTALGAFGQVVLPLHPGRYQVTVSAGPERADYRTTVRLSQGQVTSITAPLPRVVDSTGYACADLHVHSAASFDSSVPLAARVTSAVVEGLDVMAPSDHDVVADWTDAHAALDIGQRLHILLGGEISPGVQDTPAKGHFNVMPLPAGADMLSLFPHPVLTVQEIVSAAHALDSDPLVQLNHPRFNQRLGYFELIDYDPETASGRYEPLAEGFDAIEVWNGHELDLPHGGVGLPRNLGDWFGLLRHGELLIATGNSDTHRLARGSLGYPRTCVRVADDRASAIRDASFIEALRAGDVFVTSGIFLDVSAEGARPGAVLRPSVSGVVPLHIAVQAAPWVPVSRLRVYRDGEVVLERPIAHGDTADVSVEVYRDAFVVVLVSGDEDLPEDIGDPALPMPSAAFTNPIYIDADGDGVWIPPAF